MFPNAVIIHKMWGGLDHKIFVVDKIVKNNGNNSCDKKGGYRFHFEHAWADEEECKWCEEVIKQSFNSDEAETILSIPLSINQRGNSMIWQFDKKCLFSLKSAYIVALAIANAKPPSISTGPCPWWKRLWKLNLLSKVNFVLKGLQKYSSNYAFDFPKRDYGLSFMCFLRDDA
ncbi:hypothetical protein Dsin_025950 [Dipteronia sinensis]|uniref:Reverse transcriptase zinc-binding domain-containing protein n=1 Tax=Dipteronia sinensis TaxID=43782 RepID=A0AAE0DXB6_9ROSI|nr:hypothetical protein Dsin_025950 [Dipteronia sinensis]